MNSSEKPRKKQETEKKKTTRPVFSKKNKSAPRSKDPVPVVGIGASAGGLEAFRVLLEALPEKTGIAYVLVQHLDPNHESMLSELLARTTKIPVIEVKRQTTVKPDHVYVISPGKVMALEDGALTLTARSKKSGAVNMPIDHFFRSLASARKERAAGVVLSGTASDGTIGLRDIKEAGGVTFVQDRTAKYQGMPRSAIVAGVADHVLPPEKIARELADLTKHPLLNGGSESGKDEVDDRQKILSELLRVTGVDFSHYKETTLTRRIGRRMLVNKVTTQREYFEFLRGNGKEAEELFNDILIHVTEFFRDPAALRCLVRKILPQIMQRKSEKEPLRVWVPGCSTGEEVYSLVIVLLEFFDDTSPAPALQIFGTDLSSFAIEKARRGIYTKNEMENMSSRRLERFFLKIDGGYRIRKEVRNLCVFSVHDLLKDPPFSRMDIVSCCNVLIYMDTIIQRKVFSAFHYALLPYGVLILGKSETANVASGLFSQVEKKSKLFLKKEESKKILPSLLGGKEGAPSSSVSRSRPKKSAGVAEEMRVQDEANSILLRRFAPASVLINADAEIIQLWGDTQGYLKLASGKATLNLFKTAQEEIVFDLRDAVRRARKIKTSVKKEVTQPTRPRQNAVTIEVIPLRKSSEDAHFLVVFETIFPRPESEARAVPRSHTAPTQAFRVNAERVEQLEKELLDARNSARAEAEELEEVVEELQSANEEVLSANEELQSINEELETSTEELESTNEELDTVNQELQMRNEELTESRDYAESMIATVRTPLLVLDKELRIKTANRSFCHEFRTTKEATEGHFLYDLGDGQWDIPELRKMLYDILPKNSAVYDKKITHTFPVIGRRVYYLNAQVLLQKGQRGLILLAFEDITEEEKSRQKKDEFISIASHEIRTPITVIKIFAELLQKKLSDDNAKKEYAEIFENIITQSDRLTTLVTDLLSFSQLQSGDFVVKKKEFDLDPLVDRTVNVLREGVGHREIIKGSVFKGRVVADPGRIEQVLTNLLTNALKYSPDEESIIVRVERRSGEAVVSVQDHGSGIPKEDHKAIFERFYRRSEDEAAEKNSAAQGFGLGLYISAEIIRKHGGRIWVESELGKGSTFFFTLPLLEASKRVRGSRS